ncbi:mechanosensitive ion channel family protein [Pollutimonas bauzanensis]|uniref:Small-conductance mechanosensitive channel n=1 Tax=Pollutimonas bauzanensis TaxID=658167 RepID=A0A1M5WDD5_9BURK|nr:mechanosensitive ion channel domain-containing protein [Pollutimonas bauzanensis]SHH85418.1 Small-conductance mechanosensitive channel [Pollutimonas bauzanensis]
MSFSRWNHAIALVLLTVFLALSAAQGAHAAEPAAAPAGDRSALTPEQARHTLAILRDDAKRAELEQTLSAIAQATESSAAAEPAAAAQEEEAPIALTEDGLLAQLLKVTGQRLEAVADWLRLSGRTVIGLGSTAQWWQTHMGAAEQRSAALLALFKVMAILAGALLAEWLLRRLLGRARGLLHRGAPAQAAAAEPSPRAADRYLSLLRRFPFALARGVLELLPLLAFLAVASLLASALSGRGGALYNATLIIIEAYATARISLAVLRLIISPDRQSLRLLHIGDAAAMYLYRWLSWIMIIAVSGTAAANVLLEAGAGADTHEALSKLVGLLVHILLLAMVWRSRKATAAAIRGAADHRLSGIRRVLADIWPYLATVFIIAVWLLWSAGTQNGFQRLVHFFGWSAAVLIGASLVSIFALGAIDRAFIRDEEASAGQEAAAGTRNAYQLLMHRVIYIVIALLTALALLQVWGVDTRAWFLEGSVGRRLASAAGTIGVTCVLAVAAWEALNIMIGRRLDRWRLAGDMARAARLRTLVPMVRTTLFVIIAMIVLFTALSQLGINIAPLLAGASIIGVALGFGSQKLVQDFITGIFLLMENAMQVGDWVTVAGLSGSVEYLSIRTVRLRAGDGSLHVVPFSSVSTVTNTNRGIGNAAVKVSVTADSNVDEVFSAIKSVGDGMRADPKFKDLILADIEVWGVDQVDGSMITVAGQIRTLDKGRWPVQREFNRRILQCFRDRQIQFVNPKETWVISAG